MSWIPPYTTVKLQDCQQNFESLKSELARPYCMVSLLASASLASGIAAVNLTFTNEIADPDGMHATNATNIVIPKTGLYLVSMRAVLNVLPVGASTWTANVLKNGTGPPDAPSAQVLMSAVGFNYHAIDARPMVLVPGDSLTLSVLQNSGATGNVTTQSTLAVAYMATA